MCRSLLSPRNVEGRKKAGTFLPHSAVYLILCLGVVMCAHAQTNSSNDTGGSESGSGFSGTSINPSRTTESHETFGNRRVDKQHLEIVGVNGDYVPYRDTETESIQVNATTTRTVVRTYTWDANNRRNLVQVTEENAEKSASGGTHMVRTTSDSDVNGALHVSLRAVADTTNTSPDSQQVQTTTYLADGNGGFTPYLQTRELQNRSGDHVTKVNTTTLQPDADGKWKVTAVNEGNITDDGTTRTSDERLSNTDVNGKLSEVLRTVSKQSKNAAGGQSNTVETYASGIPGLTSDAPFPLVRRVTSVEQNASGEKTAGQVIEEPDPGRPDSGLQATSKVSSVAHPGPGGTQQTKTFQVRDINGTFTVIAVQTGTVQAFATPAQASPSASPKP